MVLKVSDLQARYLRFSAQNLVRKKSQAAVSGTQVVKDLVGIQAQEASAAYLSIYSRCTTITPAGIEYEIFEARSVVRAWFMRGTLHLVATEDLDWLLPLLAPIFINKNRRRYDELGLDEAAIARGVCIIEEVLANQGPMSRHQLAPYLVDKGVNIAGQALIYLINRAAWEGVLCLGPTVNGKQTYVSLINWIGRDLKEKPPAGEILLAERYLSAYGPAGQEDFAAWSGLPLKAAREAFSELGDKLAEVEFPCGRGFILSEQAANLDKSPPEALGIRLLPKFDTFLLGYNDRKLFLSPEHKKKVNAGGGILRAVLMVDGYVQGVWRITRARSGVNIDVEPFRQLSGSERQGLAEEIDGIRAFLEMDVEQNL